MGCWLILTWHYIYIYIWRVQKSRVMRIPLNHPSRGWPWINIETTMVTWGSPTSRNPHTKMKNEVVASICTPRNKKNIFYLEGVSKVFNIWSLDRGAIQFQCYMYMFHVIIWDNSILCNEGQVGSQSIHLHRSCVYIYICIYIYIHIQVASLFGLRWLWKRCLYYIQHDNVNPKTQSIVSSRDTMFKYEITMSITIWEVAHKITFCLAFCHLAPEVGWCEAPVETFLACELPKSSKTMLYLAGGF